MTARVYFNASATSNTYVEVDARMRLLDWEVREQAEEGSAAMSTIVFDDPDMDWDVTPWRGWYMVEDASTGSNVVICGGWIADQEIGREAGDRENPLARVWSVSLTDANAYWQMRVMVGADANRPAETDVERMQWMLATNEVAWAYDTTTYVQTTSPISMDAVDYRGQMLAQIMDDCAQASGRNWYTWIDLVGGVRKVMVWYGHDDWAVYDSPLSLTNDPADFSESAIGNGTSLVWIISPDTKLRRDPSRMFDGVYLPYDKGAVYRDTDPRTVRRDFIAPSYNVKTSAKAIARAVRYLSELDVQDEVISTSVELPASKVTLLRAGMRVPFRATHLPGFEGAFRWCRVLSCSVAPIDDGSRYRLTLELAPVEGVQTGGALLYEPHDYLNDMFTPADAWDVNWGGSGDDPGPGEEYRPIDVTHFTYHQSGAYDDGFEVVASSGTLNVRVEIDLIRAHLDTPDITYTASVLLNGTAVGSQSVTVPYTGWGNDLPEFDFTTTGIAVVAGDVLTVGITTSYTTLLSAIPAGTGEGLYFEILPSSVVVL